MQAAAVCDSTAPAATTGHQQVCRCARNAKRTTPRLPPARRGGVLVDRAEAEAGDLARRPGHHSHGEVAVAFHTCRQAATDRTSKRRQLAGQILTRQLAGQIARMMSPRRRRRQKMRLSWEIHP